MIAQSNSMKKVFVSLVCCFFVYAFCCSVLVSFGRINQLGSGFLVDYQDIEIANQNNAFGRLINLSLNKKQSEVGNPDEQSAEIVFKLFGIIPIKKVSVEMVDDAEYYVGGVPIGIEIDAKGAIVVGKSEGSQFNAGDIITQIDEKAITNLDDLENAVQECDRDAEVKFLRKNKEFKKIVKTQKDENGRLKLGLWVKDDVSGVGTLTYVSKKDGSYGALGHAIVDANGGNVVPVSSGKVYKCSLMGIKKGQRNEPGELRCAFSSQKEDKGSITNNTKFGISGVLDNADDLIDQNRVAKMGGRLGVKMGKAVIVSSVSGIREEYDIEIIKANFQKSADDKSIVFRVKDKRLIDLTGGIVQGMSGSPILQDGKIVGAVTHVFVNDPTKGYGVYVDWMKR